VNCAAIPGELLESELFGHEKGSFTGAVTARKGKFELANKRHHFLDEVATCTLPPRQLLRVLQRASSPRGRREAIASACV